VTRLRRLFVAALCAGALAGCCSTTDVDPGPAIVLSAIDVHSG
jgi:hypothetical protein